MRAEFLEVPISKELVLLGREYEDLKGRENRGLSVEEAARLERVEGDMRVARVAFRTYLEDLEAAFLALGAQRAKEFGAKEIDALKQVQAELKHLGPGTVLMHTLVTEDRLRLLVTTPEQQIHRHSPIGAKELSRLIGEFRETVQDPRSDPSALAQELYSYLFRPIEEDLRQANARMLLISLDDALRYLSLAALHDGEHYLAERYTLVVFTAAARRHLTTPPQPSWRVAGLGVSVEAGEEFGALPGVRRELDAIVREEGRDDPLGVLPGVMQLDADFTPENLTTDLRAGYPVVHIASHFKFRPGTDVDSFLLMGAGRRLTLAELQEGDYPLTAVDLLTLSACETAFGGRDAHGREIEGFGALAQNQGAKAVLATLWQVADASTADFMKAFYQRRERGMTKAEALRQTQVAFLRGDISSSGKLRDSADRGMVVLDPAGGGGGPADGPSYTHPYYWAPFVLMGNGL